MTSHLVLSGIFDDLLRRAGIKATQLVSMAPLTTSSSGKTTKMRMARPMAWHDSKKRTIMKSEKVERRADLNTQILAERKSVPNSGSKNAAKRHHIHAT